MPKPIDEEGLTFEDPSVELSSQRTAMSFERTHMSLDRTLMAIMRTSVSLIGFGFTVFQVFNTFVNKMPGVIPTHAPRRFAFALAAIGVLLLILGLLNHSVGSRHLQRRRTRLHEAGLISHAEPIKLSTSVVVGLLLLMIGLLAIANIVFPMWPFG